jgi:hypothetical protein
MTILSVELKLYPAPGFMLCEKHYYAIMGFTILAEVYQKIVFNTTPIKRN